MRLTPLDEDGGRVEGFHSQNDEREETFNQLLIETDRFEGSTKGIVVVVAATNRGDVLDEAPLLRLGRFYRRLTIRLPDYPSRLAILEVYAKGKFVDLQVDLRAVARSATGFSGASLKNLMNDAAIYAVRTRISYITHIALDAALDRIVLGSVKSSGSRRFLKNFLFKKLMAYHEAGHALVVNLMTNFDKV